MRSRCSVAICTLVIVCAWSAVAAGQNVKPGSVDRSGTSGIAKPGFVHVTVLPPIATRDWKAADLDLQVEQIHRLFLKTLGQKGNRRNNRPRAGSRRLNKSRKT